MTKRWSITVQIFLVVAALGGCVYVAFAPVNNLMNWFNIDDAFYYYKVAQNILAGHGITFDGINLTNGFHPLWMAVCLGIFWLSKFSLILPLRVLVVVSGLFNAATVLILYRLLRKFIHPYAAILGSLVWGLLPSIYGTTIVHGMESVISAFFLVLLISLAATFLYDEDKQATPRQMAILGLVGAFTILSRLDNLFVVTFVGLFVLFRIKKIKLALIYDWAALALAVVSSWVLRLGTSAIEQNMYSIYPMIGIAFVFFPVVYYFFGMYKGFSNKNPVSKILLQIGAGLVNFGLMYGVSSLLFQLGILRMFSRSVIVFFALISFLFVLCLRLIQRKDTLEIKKFPIKEFWQWLKRVWKSILINGVAYSIPIVFFVGGYCLFNRVVFGTFTPVSGQIKSWWGTLPNTVYAHPNTIISILGLSPNAAFGPWALITSHIYSMSKSLLRLINADGSLNSIFFIIVTIGFVFLLAAIFKAQYNRLGLLFFKLMAPSVMLGCLFQIAYYTTVGYAHTRVWYWVAEALVTTLLISVLLDGFFTWIDNFKTKTNWISATITGILVVILVFIHVRYITNMVKMTVTPGSEEAYRTETSEVEDLTPVGAKIGMTGGGMVSYFIKDRTIVNMDGLINSAAYFNAMKNGTATQFLDAIPLDYVYGNEYVVLVSDPYGEILKNRLHKIGVIRGYDNFTLYQYVLNK